MSTNLFLFYLKCIAVPEHGNQRGDIQMQNLLENGQNDQQQHNRGM